MSVAMSATCWLDTVVVAAPLVRVGRMRVGSGAARARAATDAMLWDVAALDPKRRACTQRRIGRCTRAGRPCCPDTAPACVPVNAVHHTCTTCVSLSHTHTYTHARTHARTHMWCRRAPQVMPNKLRIKVEAIYRDEQESNAAPAGENLRLRISGASLGCAARLRCPGASAGLRCVGVRACVPAVLHPHTARLSRPARVPPASPRPRPPCPAPLGAEETDISTGFVLCSLKDPTPLVSTFECQLVILELLEHNPIFTVGYRCGAWACRVRVWCFGCAARVRVGALHALCVGADRWAPQTRAAAYVRFLNVSLPPPPQNPTTPTPTPTHTHTHRSVLHIHTVVEECEVTKLLYAVDMKTKEQKKVRPGLRSVLPHHSHAVAGRGTAASHPCALKPPPPPIASCDLPLPLSAPAGQVCQVGRDVRVPHHHREARVHRDLWRWGRGSARRSLPGTCACAAGHLCSALPSTCASLLTLHCGVAAPRMPPTPPHNQHRPASHGPLHAA
jgi:hypothetical protein